MTYVLSYSLHLGSSEECSAGVAGDGPVVSPRLGRLNVAHHAPVAHDDMILFLILFTELNFSENRLFKIECISFLITKTLATKI